MTNLLTDRCELTSSRFEWMQVIGSVVRHRLSRSGAGSSGAGRCLLSSQLPCSRLTKPHIISQLVNASSDCCHLDFSTDNANAIS